MASRFELFVQGRSLLHRLDPRTKMAWTLWVFVIALVFNDPKYLACVLLLVFLAFLSSGVPLSRMAGPAVVLIPVLLMAMLTWPLFERSGDVVVRIGPVSVTDLGLLFALAMGLRIVIPVLAATLLFATTKRRDIVLGLEGLGLPYKAGFAITIAFGFLPALAGVGETIIEAQKARALELERGSVLERVRKHVAVIAPLLIGAIGYIQKLAFSMDSRGYGAEPKRTSLRSLSPTSVDYALTAVAAFTLVAAIVVRFSGYGAVFPGRL